MKDLAYTLGARREHLPHRAFCVTNGNEPLEPSPVTKTRTPPQIIFVFTGQGAQWTGMGKQLMEDFSEFRNDIKEMDKVLGNLPTPPAWTIEGDFRSERSGYHVF